MSQSIPNLNNPIMINAKHRWFVDTNRSTKIVRQTNIRFNFFHPSPSQTSLLLDDHGFFTEGAPRQARSRRHLFKRTARGIYFLIILQHRSAISRLVSSHGNVELSCFVFSSFVPESSQSNIKCNNS